MNTKLLLPFLITTLLVSDSLVPEIGHAEPPIQVAQSIGKPFSSAPGNFTVLIPGTPHQEHDTITTEKEKSLPNSVRLAGGVTGTVSPPRSILNAQLRQAVCTQNWSQAINVVNRMIGQTIGQTDSQEVRQQLLDYKQKLQGFASSDSVVPASELPDCSPGNGEGN
ncbi:MAG: hypothetical protein RIM23_17700 [Coleofasciculus sp. G3-WIS-01]|uniref:hypothetical protein n=1 Tax=Coleofasciculus sp. G3-WIS-01 TaxID=3069528 RepID=UPI0032F91658